jgi:hypothetical protein
VDRAVYLSLDEIRALDPLPQTNWEVAQRALSSDRRLLMPKTASNQRGQIFNLFIG